MEELMKEITIAYIKHGKAFTNNPMPFDERIESLNAWWRAVSPEKVMKLVFALERGGYSTPPNGEGSVGSGHGV